MVPRFDWVKKVLIIGSGAIKIGEAGEFDYSGAQAIKALKEEGIFTILVNPNIATIQTDEKFADKNYFLPITAEWVERIIEKERPDGILLGFGGQTALNCGMELHEKRILEKYNVRVLGTGTEAIKIADERELFRELMINKKIPIPKSEKAQSMEEAIEAADRIGYPVMVRVSYTLGGHGSGVAKNISELVEIVSLGLAHSRIHQVLIEEYLEKWKEIEYEVMRDPGDNCTIVCNMENFDPMGIHTGDSIVVAPSQTLTNREYHSLRDACFKIVRALGIVGECNVQFALNPESSEFRVIEVNSRLSRSSALASKATGYPIAYIAAKLSLGYTLHELTNKITGKTSACFEPSLDYITVKIPRWDFQKFSGADRKIGTQMKSVGEVMAIGRNFEEAFQKAVRMVDVGLELTDLKEGEKEKIVFEIKNPTDRRIFHIARALELGISVEEINELSGIDRWFLWKIKNIVEMEKKIKSIGLEEKIILEAKKLGFSDKKLSALVGRSKSFVRNFRKDNGIVPVVKQIDTLAGEWAAETNYLYISYGGSNDISPKKTKKVIVLGSGVYRIGSSVEFDWCCVNMANALKKRGFGEVIMVNYNPETVSTDYDIPDKLYFEELTLERVLDIIDFEQPEAVVVSVGGQIPNNLALKLKENGIRLLGTDAEKIDLAENRAKFSELLDKLKISQPQWRSLKNISSAKEFSRKVGYPVIIRPSYILSGAAMRIAKNDEELEKYLKTATEVSPEHPVVISKFISGAREVEVDAVSDGENVFIGAIMEHIEDAGVHSGDATICIQTFSIPNDVKEKIRESTRKLASALKIKGPFNVQYLVNDEIMVIECNLRASRSMPFVSKTIGESLMDIAADVFIGKKISDSEGTPKFFAVKSPQFSFSRLLGADPVTGVEMVSTGEVACFGKTFEEAFAKSLEASGVKPLNNGDNVLIVGNLQNFYVSLLNKLNIISAETHKPAATENLIQNKKIKICFSFFGVEDGRKLRRKCADFSVPVISNEKLAEALLKYKFSSIQAVEFTEETPAHH